MESDQHVVVASSSKRVVVFFSSPSMPNYLFGSFSLLKEYHNKDVNRTLEWAIIAVIASHEKMFTDSGVDSKSGGWSAPNKSRPPRR